MVSVSVRESVLFCVLLSVSLLEALKDVWGRELPARTILGHVLSCLDGIFQLS